MNFYLRAKIPLNYFNPTIRNKSIRKLYYIYYCKKAKKAKKPALKRKKRSYLCQK